MMSYLPQRRGFEPPAPLCGYATDATYILYNFVAYYLTLTGLLLDLKTDGFFAAMDVGSGGQGGRAPPDFHTGH